MGRHEPPGAGRRGSGEFILIFSPALRMPHPSGRMTTAAEGIKRLGELLAPDRWPENKPSRACRLAWFMIADDFRYMSVRSWKQWDSHGLSGTSPGLKQSPARPGRPRSRAISAGSGRCWVRTNVGLADGLQTVTCRVRPFVCGPPQRGARTIPAETHPANVPRGGNLRPGPRTASKARMWRQRPAKGRPAGAASRRAHLAVARIYSATRARLS